MSGPISESSASAGSVLRAFIREMRPHQWAKNLLVFVPLLTAHEYTSVSQTSTAFLGFLLFSLCASGVYFLNDLVDLDADRKHPGKRRRPLASGELPVSMGVAGAIGLPLLALAASTVFLPIWFVIVLVVYFLTSTAYSLYLKRISTADVITLAALYTVRIIAGGAAAGITLSSWLLAFSVFFFLSLSYLKRYTELVRSDGNSKVPGRGYASEDRESIFVLGVANAIASVVVLSQYISSEDVIILYRNPKLLWLMCLLLLYWTNRLWIGARRNKINDDPVLFALKDPISRFVGLALVAVLLMAHHLPSI